jgi:hypothetical protein
MMEIVTKVRPRKRRCRWCKKHFQPKPAGRPGLYCSASCRQRTYEKRKWSEFSGLDALALDLLPWATQRKMIEQARHAHMIELLKNGTVPLTDIAQIDGVLDPLEPHRRMSFLKDIESRRRARNDDQALGIIAQWRLLRQQPLGAPPVVALR